MSDPVVRVVVVTYSPGPTLRACLDSLATSTNRPLEVVLADNDSSDGTPEQAAAADADLRLVRTGGNVGYGRAANVGVGLGSRDSGSGGVGGAGDAGREWLLVANPDVVFTPGSLDTLLDAGAAWPSAGALGPAILTPAGELYPSARSFPSLGRGLGHAVFGAFWPSNPWTRSYRREGQAPAEGPADWLSGSCLLVRREAFEAVGGFDPAYFMYFEDLDLCRRLAVAGWASVYVPTAVVRHLGGHASEREPVRMLRAHHASAYRFLAGQYRGRRWLPMRLALRVGLGLRYLVSTRVRRVGEGARPTRPGDVLPGGRGQR